MSMIPPLASTAGHHHHDDNWLRFTVERMPAVLWSTDTDLRFTSYHGAGLAALGIRSQELIGVSLLDYFQTTDNDFPAIRAHRQALEGRRSTYDLPWQGRIYFTTVEPLRSNSGQVIGCIGVAFDATDARHELLARERQLANLEQLLRHVPAMLYQTAGKTDGSSFRINYVSPRAQEFIGIAPADLIAEPMQLLDSIHLEDRPGYYEKAIASMQSGSVFDYEFRCVSRDGTIRWLRATSAPMTFPDDELIYHGVAIDISAAHERHEQLRASNTQLSEYVHGRMHDLLNVNERLEREVAQRRRMEEALHKQTGLMDGVLAHMPVVAFRISPQLEIFEAHGAGLGRIGPGDAYLGAYDAAIKKPEMRDAVTQALAGGSARIITEGGDPDHAWAFDTFLTFDSASNQGVIGFALDVTERNQAVRELKQSEERWHSLTDASSDIVLMLDEAGYVTYVNRTVPGLTVEEVIGSHATRWVPPGDQVDLMARLKRVLDTGMFEHKESQGHGPHGALAWYAVRIGPYRQAGKVVGAVMYITDITQRKLSEQAQLSSEQRYRLLMDAANDAIVIIDAENERIVEANALALGITGHLPDRISQLTHVELYAPEHQARVRALFAEHAKSGQGLITDVEMLDSLGQAIPVEVSLRWITIDGKRLAIGIMRDVTERKKSEQALRNEERLLRELLNLQERERRLIAYEIHDGFVQDVVGAHLALEGLAARLERGEPVAAEQLTMLRRLLRQSIDEGRRMISELRPMIIDERGIIDAISYLISEHAQQGGPEVAFVHDVSFERLSPLLEGTMFRIVQEALNNVQRHSGASIAEVELLQEDGRLRLVIRDHGVGFDLKQVPTDRFGLRGMKERARLFGGHTTIRSQPGRGTEVLVDMPIDMYLADGDGV